MSDPKSYQSISTPSVKGGRLQWPDIELIRVTQRGMVFRSHQLFDLGDTLSIGIHLEVAQDGPQSTGGKRADFLKVEGAVVACQMVSWGGIDRRFEITVLFQSVAENDGGLLDDIGRASGLAMVPHGADDAENPGLGPICGLN